MRSLEASSPWPPVPPAVRLDRQARQVVAAVDWTPTATATIAERVALPLGVLSATLVSLEGLGLIRGDGGWWERAGS